eukprot:TRINITY_DN67377_c0_g1_i1.p1 TRINITY_DN67377_c0_g1~~TRINITY_DN67377_c0_g1_i1.p1  ORF type:complete len:420 (+),score=70.30 TRINITY_DN67377_c0_g1_i1:73-1332(+)
MSSHTLPFRRPGDVLPTRHAHLAPDDGPPRFASASQGRGVWLIGRLQHEYISCSHAFAELVLGSYVNLLLIFLPVSLLSYYGQWPSWVSFVLAALSMAPLAALLGDVTEDLALRTNQACGALLNATFGNAAQLIVCLFALRVGLYDVVKWSLLGTLLSNVLLSLGVALLVGGVRRHSVQVNVQALRTYTSLLFVAVMGTTIPTVFNYTHPQRAHRLTIVMSRALSIVMCFSYMAYLYFQLRTHRSNYEDIDVKVRLMGAPRTPLWFALMLLGMTVLLISQEGDIIVKSVVPTVQQLGLNPRFLGVVVLPLCTNAAELATVVLMGQRERMDIACGVAIGSSIQISLFCTPLLVLVSWVWQEGFDLSFYPFSTIGVLAAVMVTSFLVFDGSGTWLTGLMLIVSYLMLVVAYFLAPLEWPGA